MATVETRKLYNGEVEINFYPESHRYKKLGDKGWLTSVTAITGIIDKSRVLINWAIGLSDEYFQEFFKKTGALALTVGDLQPIVKEALNQHNVKREEAADIGSQVHDIAQQIGEALRDGKDIPELSPEMEEGVAHGVRAFIDWVVGYKVKFLECERMVYSKKHDFVGLTDAIIEIDGKKYLIDYKTSKRVYSEMQYQLAAYTLAYEEEANEKLDGQMLIHFNKETGDFNVVEVGDKDNKINQKTFLACLKIKSREKELNKA